MAGSYRSCCVSNCGKTRIDNVVLHAFPDPRKETERFKMWVNAVGSSVSTLDNQFIFRNRKICHNHFEEKYLTWTRRLVFGAVPTLHLPGSQVERLLLRDITNIVSNDVKGPVPSISKNYIKETNLEPLIASTSSDVTSTNNPEWAITDKISALTSSRHKQKGSKFMSDKTALVKMLKTITKKKYNYAIRLKKALRLSENRTFQNTLKKFTTLSALFLAMQFREIKKNKSSRRFTEQEKIMALSIYKQGPRCYRMLSKIFVLPSPHTLSRLIARAALSPGINVKLFNVMKKK